MVPPVLLTQEFHLRWQPTNAEFEEVLLARRKVTRAVWGERIAGALAIAFGLLGFLVGEILSGVWFVVTGVVVATGWAHWFYRHLVIFPRNSADYDHEWDVTISARGIVDVSGGMRTETPWTFWKTWLLTPSALALLTRPRGRTTVLVLARRGLAPGHDWEQLVKFVVCQDSRSQPSRPELIRKSRRALGS